jgi:hypothetical protein
MATIKIKKKITKVDDRHRLQVWVNETSDNIPAEIFLFNRLPPVPTRPTPEDIFMGVCDYSDILLYPNINVTENPYYRKNGVDLIFTSYKTLTDYFEDNIRSKVEYLVNDIVGANNAAVVETDTPIG